jgi:UDP-N-acetylmuramate-alanine ligase
MTDDFEPIEPGEVVFRLDLTAAQLKVTHTALRSLLDDYGHDEQDVIKVIRTVIDKLPDEHSIRAIDLKHEAARETRAEQ